MKLLKQYLFAVKDNKSSTFEAAHFSKNVVEAVRAWTNAVNSQDSRLGQWPDDFALYRLGSLDLDTGVLECLAQPEHLSNARDVLKVQSIPESVVKAV